MKLWWSWPLLLALLCPGLAWAEPPPSDALFAATLTGLDDKPAALAKFIGKPLIVNFWARWCGPCRTEIPELVALSQKYRERGLEVIGIGLEDQVDSVRDFAKAYDMDYPVLLAKDQGLPLMQALGNSRTVSYTHLTLPTIYSV